MGVFDRLGKALNKLGSPLSDEEAYQIVAGELAREEIDPGLWTRAMAECDFDKNRAKAIYVKARVAALHHTAADEAMRKRAWYRSVEENAYRHLEKGEYDLAMVGFVERVKNQNDVNAMHNLGWLVERGHVENATLEAAVGWYKKAAENGRHASALSAAHALFRAQRYREAYDWAEIAFQNGVPGARDVRLRFAGIAGVHIPWWKR